MPIYEYQCQGCGHQLEAIQKISDPVLVDCPACEQPELKKMVTAAAFRLKGGGWYETDFKSGDRKKNLHGDPAKPGKDASGAKSTESPSKSGDKSTAGGSEKSA